LRGVRPRRSLFVTMAASLDMRTRTGAEATLPGGPGDPSRLGQEDAPMTRALALLSVWLLVAPAVVAQQSPSKPPPGADCDLEWQALSPHGVPGGGSGTVPNPANTAGGGQNVGGNLPPPQDPVPTLRAYPDPPDGAIVGNGPQDTTEAIVLSRASQSPNAVGWAPTVVLGGPFEYALVEGFGWVAYDTATRVASWLAPESYDWTTDFRKVRLETGTGGTGPSHMATCKQGWYVDLTPQGPRILGYACECVGRMFPGLCPYSDAFIPDDCTPGPWGNFRELNGGLRC